MHLAAHSAAVEACALLAQRGANLSHAMEVRTRGDLQPPCSFLATSLSPLLPHPPPLSLQPALANGWQNGRAPLHTAAQGGHEKIVSILLEYRADPNAAMTVRFQRFLSSIADNDDNNNNN